MNGYLLRLKNRSKLVEGSLFAVNDLILGAKLSICFLYGV